MNPNPKLQILEKTSWQNDLFNIFNNRGVSLYALLDPNIVNIFITLHLLFDIEWAYGLHPTMKDGEIGFKFEEQLPSAGPRPQEDLDNFKKLVEYWTCLRDELWSMAK